MRLGSRHPQHSLETALNPTGHVSGASGRDLRDTLLARCGVMRFAMSLTLLGIAQSSQQPSSLRKHTRPSTRAGNVNYSMIEVTSLLMPAYTGSNAYWLNREKIFPALVMGRPCLSVPTHAK
mmetsp:Transcript_9675/g.22367  ORF Transcript_9675/g.22367 Transcript_9675/m.22367 type:complete len:122 (-) Transcript_9675:272-637(-)